MLVMMVELLLTIRPSVHQPEWHDLSNAPGHGQRGRFAQPVRGHLAGGGLGPVEPDHQNEPHDCTRLFACIAAPSGANPAFLPYSPRRGPNGSASTAANWCTAVDRSGLMGIVADATMAAGGQAVGIIPALEAGGRRATVVELHVVDNMHERKRMMADKTDLPSS
jgi:hypothetical protein